MKTIKTTVPVDTYDTLDREAGRRGCSVAELLRWCIAVGMHRSHCERVCATLEGTPLYDLPKPKIVKDTGAWS